MASLNRHRKAGRFRGGLKLPGHKLAGEAGRIRSAPLPAEIVLPLGQHIGAAAEPVVAVGDRVLRGQVVARSAGFVSAPVHASTSGTVTAIESRPVPHPSGLPARVIAIRADGEDEAAELPAPANTDALTPEELRGLVREAGIVGLGGAAFPSAVKLDPGQRGAVEMLILNGAECEPHISCDQALMSERPAQVVEGAALMLRALGAARCVIGIEDRYSGAIRALEAAIADSGHVAIEICVVPTRYPQGGEKQLIQTITGEEVPSEGLPLDLGIVVHNVATAAAVARAVTLGEPLISRIVTVTGSGVVAPANLEVRLGTPMAELIRHCGGYRGDDRRLIMGGPMMGFALGSDTLPVVKATNCVLVADSAELAPTAPTRACIRCGDCVDVCPAGLLPQQLYWHARAREFDKAQRLNLFDCIECGCCAQVCPSQLPLVQYYRFAKHAVNEAETERRKADIARDRHEQRSARLEREKKAKEEARRKKREALKARQAAAEAASEQSGEQPPAANDAVAAAIAKAKAEKARRQAEAAKQDE